MEASHFVLTLGEHPMDHGELCRVLTALDRRYECLQLGILGKSILGRELFLARIGHGEKNLVLVGTHHGMEWITTLLLCRFLYELCDGIEKKRTLYRMPLAQVPEAYTLHFIPMLNPDGVEYQIHSPDPSHPLYPRLLSMNGGSTDFSHWQANARGVDLNHNYNAGFLEYKLYEREHKIPCGAPTLYSGTSPESEPETAALCSYLRMLGRVDLLLSLHTQGEEVYYSSGGQIPRHSEAILWQILDKSGYTPAVAHGSAAFGGLLDFSIRTLGIPAFTIECGKGKNPLPLSDAGAIYQRLREVFFTLPRMV